MGFTKQYKTGALEDLRTSEDKEKDFLYKEIATAPYVEWREKPMCEWRSFPKQDQKGVGSCVSHSLTKILGIENGLEENTYLKLNPLYIYTHRVNYPNDGMNANDALNLASTIGSPLYDLFPVKFTEQEALALKNYPIPESFKTIAKLYKGGGFVYLNPANIDEIANIIHSRKKGVLLFFRFGPENNGGSPEPKFTETKNWKYRHAVVGIDFTLINGKKYIIIDDSSGPETGFDKNGRRKISEEGFNGQDCWVSAYLEDFANKKLEAETTLPKYQWNRDLSVGSSGEDVKMLQTVLSMIGDDNGSLFPLVQFPTGLFYGMTRSAVKRFQIKYGITPAEGYFGPITREKLNSMCK